MAWVEKHGDGFRVRYRLPDNTLYSETGFSTRDKAEKRAVDMESDQRRDQFTDPRLARITFGDWVQQWTDAHDVSEGTWAKYDSHLRIHILPQFAHVALGDIKRIVVKGWVRKLRRSLAELTVGDMVTLLSMILGEAVDEELIGANPCLRLRVNIGDRPERPHATADEVDALAARVSFANAVLVTLAAYVGMRWGELAGLQWPNGRLQLGPPKTPASVRTVYVPKFLVEALTELRRRNPTARFVFLSADGGLYRRSNFRRRVWLPALAGDPDQGWTPIQPGMHFHDLRHTCKTWLIEDGVPDVLQHKQLGHNTREYPARTPMSPER
jgi:integrase